MIVPPSSPLMRLDCYASVSRLLRKEGSGWPHVIRHSHCRQKAVNVSIQGATVVPDKGLRARCRSHARLASTLSMASPSQIHLVRLAVARTSASASSLTSWGRIVGTTTAGFERASGAARDRRPRLRPVGLPPLLRHGLPGLRRLAAQGTAQAPYSPCRRRRGSGGRTSACCRRRGSGGGRRRGTSGTAARLPPGYGPPRALESAALLPLLVWWRGGDVWRQDPHCGDSLSRHLLRVVAAHCQDRGSRRRLGRGKGGRGGRRLRCAFAGSNGAADAALQQHWQQRCRRREGATHRGDKPDHLPVRLLLTDDLPPPPPLPHR